ncbi:MAG TPA: protein-glutamate O-methyltransferase CheR [Clostridia bacterium]|nr:protein-glutamate O-methyltransferase CheR [Clostridia bacterium]
MYGEAASMEFAMVQRFIEEICGIALGEEKAYLLESKLARLLVEFGASSFEELYIKLCSTKDPYLVDSVIDAVTINETFWFRDKTPWYIIEDILLPAFLAELRDGKREKARIWSAACSYGQEPYSTAMCIDSFLNRMGAADISSEAFEILASDISKDVLRMAEAGNFDNISVSRGLEDDYKFRYFRNEGRIWRLDEDIKRRVSFRQFNLVDRCFPYGQFDIIFCRYVLIYFSEKYKKEVMNRITDSLKPGGVLFIGSSELFEDYSRCYTMERYKNGIYYRKKECW